MADKKKRKPSAYAKRFGRHLKAGKSWKEAHRLAKGGKARKKASKPKSKAKAKTKRKSATKSASTAQTRRRSMKFPIFTGIALGIPVLLAVEGSGLDEGEITKDKLIKAFGYYAECYFPIEFRGGAQIGFSTKRIAGGLGPMLILGLMKAGQKMTGRIFNTRGIPVSTT